MENLNSENTNIEKIEEWKKLENHHFDENNFYRVVNEAGYKDLMENGIVRSSTTGSKSDIVDGFEIGGRPTAFPSFSKSQPDLSYLEEGMDNYIFEINTPMYKRGDENPVTGNPIKGRHWAYRSIDENGNSIIEMKLEQIKNIYKIDKDRYIYLKNDSNK